MFADGTNHISQSETVLTHQVIPIIDILTDKLQAVVGNTRMHMSIWHGAQNAIAVLNKYYARMDDSVMYWAAMSEHAFSFHPSPPH